MKPRPIIFSAAMVRAILAGRKTQTRRIMKPQPVNLPDGAYCDPYNGNYEHFTFWTNNNKMILGSGGNIPNTAHWKCPYGQPGDRLWVREKHYIGHKNTWGGLPKIVNPNDPAMACWYAAGFDRSAPYRWRPSIHMPRWASRIALEITDVRVERVQEIGEEDAIAEGSKEPSIARIVGGCLTERSVFAKYWNHLYGTDAFVRNDWVFVIEFERVRGFCSATGPISLSLDGLRAVRR